VCEIADIGLIASRVASRFGFRAETFHQLTLELEQSLLVVVDIHGVTEPLDRKAPDAADVRD